MIPVRRQLVIAFTVLPAQAGLFALLATESVTDALIVAGVTCASMWLHIALHECGHLVMARLLRLPVVASSGRPAAGTRSWHRSRR